MKKPYFAENEIYHIYNRGVEKRSLFMSDEDYFRFIHDLYEFNDENITSNLTYYFNRKNAKVEPQQLKSGQRNTKQRKPIIEILAFVLMPNHFHLLVRQKKEGGITKFMRKLGTGYAMYFNKKYERVGGLFQGDFKAIVIKEEPHFIHLPFYIHANPLALIYRGETSIDSLEKYRWSSYLDYIGIKNFPSVISRNFLLDFFGGSEEYKKAMRAWIHEEEKNMMYVSDVILEN